MLTEHMKQISKERENIDCVFQQNSFAPVSVLEQNPMAEDDLTLRNDKRKSNGSLDNSIVSLNNNQNGETFVVDSKKEAPV